jgi:hypothetical protein
MQLRVDEEEDGEVAADVADAVEEEVEDEEVVEEEVLSKLCLLHARGCLVVLLPWLRLPKRMMRIWPMSYRQTTALSRLRH